MGEQGCRTSKHRLLWRLSSAETRAPLNLITLPPGMTNELLVLKMSQLTPPSSAAGTARGDDSRVDNDLAVTQRKRKVGALADGDDAIAHTGGPAPKALYFGSDDAYKEDPDYRPPGKRVAAASPPHAAAAAPVAPAPPASALPLTLDSTVGFHLHGEMHTVRELLATQGVVDWAIYLCRDKNITSGPIFDFAEYALRVFPEKRPENFSRASILSFGKYKGQPATVALADAKYIAA